MNQIAQSLEKSTKSGASTVSKDGDPATSAKLEAMSTALDGLETSMAQLASSSALALGRSFGYPAGVLAPTNAGYIYAGAQIQDAIEGAEPYAKGAGIIGTAAVVSYSTYEGYRSGGATGGFTNLSYSGLDAAVDTGLIRAGGLPGLGLAVIYNALGGSKATAVAAQISICASKAGIPPQSPPF